MTEPGAGSDLRGMKATARQDGSDWVLNGTKHFNCSSQEALLQLVAEKATTALLAGGAQTGVELVSGQHATYAAIKRVGSKLIIDHVAFHSRLDTRPGKRYDRTMLCLDCR